MTACAIEGVGTDGNTEDVTETGLPHRPAALTLAADGSYAARLIQGPGGGWYPERWTLDGCEPYAVPLPGRLPEQPDSALLPLTDGRVLILRRTEGHCTVALLYPTGPGTGELPLGAVETEELTLLPPAPGGTTVHALSPVGGDGARRATAVWLLHGGGDGPQRIALVPGRCTGGAWLDREGRLLALDRELDGPAKTVVVDLGRGGEVSPLLQITERSNDRLLLADPDSGLILLRSDAPGYDRMGWGVLGSTLPVRFPEALRAADAALTPFAVQPGQALAPESCAVAFRVDAAAGTWLATWRPSMKQLHRPAAPGGWLAGTGHWTPDGELRLPYATPATPCGVARVTVPWDATAPDAASPLPALPAPAPAAAPASHLQRLTRLPWDTSSALPPASGIRTTPTGYPNGCTTSAQPDPVAREPHVDRTHPQPCRPVPLQQAPLAAREAR
ncbi:hypothetical protein [Streptomyces purpurogeneiscleroticus]|uniref:hypothetical protein n=1 Tax=Streptomyces purpurogeneiscleroticus TaxID=68259 RepID=UPI001CC1014E|nr:hypothetical protein [Streptomyces purpurogeneiscleroticus]MBZ4020030.1 hypothetical protein [Streptomyces purpurogeneiscleroticus]